MSTAATSVLTPNARRHIGFVAVILFSSLVFYKTLSALVQYSLHDESSSQIILIPLVAFFLLYIESQAIFSSTRTSAVSGSCLVLGGLALFLLAHRSTFPQDGNWPLSLQTLSVVLVWVGGFLLCYGSAAFRAAIFPLMFLLLMVPLPRVVLDWVIHALQEGSTEIAYLLFQAVGTPVFRHGFQLTVPGVTIEVAQECSSIRSSIALFITCLLAGHLYLRKGWKVLLLVLLSLPLALLKNGIRIATLTLLSIHVDPSFLTGKLHHEGGFVFFFLSLLLIWPVFWALERSDNKERTARQLSKPVGGTSD
jgi:exosortase